MNKALFIAALALLALPIAAFGVDETLVNTPVDEYQNEEGQETDATPGIGIRSLIEIQDRLYGTIDPLELSPDYILRDYRVPDETFEPENFWNRDFRQPYDIFFPPGPLNLR